MALDLDAAARIELSRHKEGLLYAERQQMKRGEFEAVASGVLRRAKIQASIFIALAVWAFFLDALTRPQSSVAVILMAVAGYLQYSHARRTAETIRALVNESERKDPSSAS